MSYVSTHHRGPAPLNTALDSMSNLYSDLELQLARETLWSDMDPLSEEFAEALALMRAAVEGGALEDAGLVAEITAFPGPHHDAAVAYKLYYVSHALDGALVAFANESDQPEHYLGPVGDFRNEAIVSDLVSELGLAALPALDAEAAALLAHGI